MSDALALLLSLDFTFCYYFQGQHTGNVGILNAPFYVLNNMHDTFSPHVSKRFTVIITIPEMARY
jgi:hypothetical protein